jgi:hypothetical protein
MTAIDRVALETEFMVSKNENNAVASFTKEREHKTKKLK